MGVLWKAVRASMTVIDYLPPMQVDDHLLIDGGYINNLPADVMWDYYSPNLVIAVDVETKDGDKFHNVARFGDHCSGWWLFFQKMWQIVNPFVSPLKLPKFQNIVVSLNYIAHNRNIRKLVQSGKLDLYIKPDLGNTALLDYDKMDQIVDIGYRLSQLKLREFRAKYNAVLPPVTNAKMRSLRIRLSRTSSVAAIGSQAYTPNPSPHASPLPSPAVRNSTKYRENIFESTPVR